MIYINYNENNGRFSAYKLKEKNNSLKQVELKHFKLYSIYNTIFYSYSAIIIILNRPNI